MLHAAILTKDTKGGKRLREVSRHSSTEDKVGGKLSNSRGSKIDKEKRRELPPAAD